MAHLVRHGRVAAYGVVGHMVRLRVQAGLVDVAALHAHLKEAAGEERGRRGGRERNGAVRDRFFSVFHYFF